ncbi:hypothetical protein EYF80_015338 [Liparis tanakae]|uniref:Uncharacterized protein n=1 Tax=Liparis tanakae TaxID=230148 RepID=A0A4Z2I8J2_9TELE|nr:hypothetical protein EYF80_015338 [Liparis tanakae]
MQDRRGEGERTSRSSQVTCGYSQASSFLTWKGGEEGAKGSAKGSLAGREEEEKSPGGCCWRKGPRRWKDSDESALETADLLPEAQTQSH